MQPVNGITNKEISSRKEKGGLKLTHDDEVQEDTHNNAEATTMNPNHTIRKRGVSFRESLTLSAKEMFSPRRAPSFVTDANNSLISLPDIPSFDRHSSTFMAAVNLQSMILGTSVLSFPFAFSVAGVYAIFLTLFIGGLTSYTAAILEDCLYKDSTSIRGFRKRVRSSFVDMCQACCPKAGEAIMQFMVYFSMARNIVVLVLLTDLTEELSRKTLSNIDPGVWTCVWAAGVIPFLLIKRVSVLAWVSLIGLILYVVALVALLIAIVAVDPSWSITNIKIASDWNGIGLAIGIIINSYSQHLTFPSLEASMRHPEKYKMTIHTSFFLNILIKIGFGLIGVLNFGNHTAQSITGNLPPIDSLSIPIRVSIVFFTYFTIPIQSFVIFELIDITFLPHFPLFCNENGDRSFCWLLLSRTIVMNLCLLVAVLVPDFGVIVSLIGSVRGTLICLIFPPLFYLHLCSDKLSPFQKVLCVGVIIVGILFGCWGCIAASWRLFSK